MFWKISDSRAKNFLLGAFDQLFTVALGRSGFLSRTHFCQFKTFTNQFTQTVINFINEFFVQTKRLENYFVELNAAFVF